MLKKIGIFLIFFAFFSNSFAIDITKNNCNAEYLRKLEVCKQAIIAGSYKSLDFMCIQKDTELQLFQIVLDENFKKIDKEAKRELEFLNENKDYYFRTDKDSPSFLDGINDIMKNFGVYGKYYKEYKKACYDTINEEFAYCLREIPKKEDSISNQTLLNSYKDVCFGLAQTKLEIYQATAFEMLILDKLALRKDNRTGFTQETRKSYSNLVRLMDININLLEKILFKWPLKIKKGYTG